MMPPHLKYLNLALRNAVTTPDSVVIIHAPPRHGKSLLCSWALPTWYLGAFPERRVIMAGHSDRYAAKWGRRCRDSMAYYGHQLWGHTVRGDSKAANAWNLIGREGGMETVGVGTGIAGLGANLLIIDDPIAKPEQALSAVTRQSHWDWWTGVAENRLEPGATLVLIMHRWHADDLAGRLLSMFRQTGREIINLRFPAIAEEGDILGRQIGEALWPERYPIAKLRQREQSQGFWYSALYQGRPTPMGGTLFRSEWFAERRFTMLDDGSGRQGYVLADTGEVCLRHECYHFVFCDPSLGKKYSDRCGIGVFAVTPSNRLLVLHFLARRIPVEDIANRVDATARAWNAEFVGFEANGFQIQLANAARRICSCPVRELDPEGKSKLVRGIPAVELAHEGNILLPPDGTPWLAEFLEPLCLWSGKDGDRDEEADVVAYAAQEIVRRRDTSDVLPMSGTTGYTSWASY